MSSDSLKFTANGVTYSLTVTFAGTATSGTVIAISGTVGAQQVTGLVTYDGSDQKINATSPYLTLGGLSFVAGGVDYNLAYVSSLGTYQIQTGATTKLTTYNVSGFTFAANVCFVEGTRILTERGEVAVEHLRVGDLAVTASGALRPIRWLGHRRIDCVDHPRRRDVLPVRIGAHAFGPNRPHRDLSVSPGHALCVDVLGEVLIRAGRLVNGATIQQVATQSVVYWHLELDSHDIVFAENLPVESYLEMNNRSFFEESGVVSLVEAPDAVDRADAQFCRPMLDAGPLVEAVREQLGAHARALGWKLTRRPFNDLHLVADGVRVDPVLDGLTARFDVPGEAGDVRLVCIASTPFHLPGPNRDMRALGLCLKRIMIGETEIALDDPRLTEGFHALETASAGAFRWMSGEAVLPASMFVETPHGRRLSLDLLAPPLPFWVEPVAPEQNLAA